MRRWLLEEYFPYYEWSVAANSVERTSSAVSQFEDWVLKNYFALTKTEAFAPFFLRQALSKAVESGPAVVIVVDGLSWGFCSEMGIRLAQCGISSPPPMPTITTLPSETSTAKPSLIRGQLPGQIVYDDQPSYGVLLSESMGLDPNEIAMASTPEKTLEDLIRPKKQAYLYLYNNLDELVHKSLSPEKRRQLISSTLDDLCQEVAEARKLFLIRHGVAPTFIVCSDHGFTELPKPTKVTCQPECGEALLSHCRVLRTNCLPELVGEGLATVSRDMLGGGNVLYIISRGYTCVGSRPRGATHGGLTPQEIIVPVWALGDEDVTYRDVEIALVGEVRRGRPENVVELRIANPNATSVRVQDVKLTRATISRHLPVDVPPNGEAVVQTVIDATGLVAASLALEGYVAVGFAGNTKMTPITRTIQTTGAAVSDLLFEQEFDE
ncbi:MAG: hypothetical protein C4551_05135 [Bacillota bacterium]|nr:MAG: hypothetical protein C4551_05135 [Bacillota bacterium]